MCVCVCVCVLAQSILCDRCLFIFRSCNVIIMCLLLLCLSQMNFLARMICCIASCDVLRYNALYCVLSQGRFSVCASSRKLEQACLSLELIKSIGHSISGKQARCTIAAVTRFIK